MRTYYELELEDTKQQLEQDLRVLNDILYKITRATTEKEILNLTIRATKYLSNVVNDKTYMINLKEEHENNQDNRFIK